MQSSRQDTKQLALEIPGEDTPPGMMPEAGGGVIRADLTAVIDTSINSVKLGRPPGQNRAALLRNLRRIKGALENRNAKLANRGAEDLLRFYEGEIEAPTPPDAGPGDSPAALVYSSPRVKRDHLEALRILHKVRLVTGLQCDTPRCPACRELSQPKEGEEPETDSEADSDEEIWRLVALSSQAILNVQAGQSRTKRSTEYIRNFKAIKEGLAEGDAELANDGVDQLLRQVEASGDVLKTQEIGPYGSPEVVIYGSANAKRNHRFVLQLSHDIRSVTGLECNNIYCPTCGTPENRNPR